ncbi:MULTISPECIES: winged helix-turn-helix transcriptional regulator [unclassified Brevundimonas]|uniref:winged helix-turn-helix transcriptional regulator n=1 Tax=unclassified Brevundimonas TaxID=2622653 RepID=UPI0025B95385|nr:MULTISPECIES: helix-turn-helix domain-containing protein [unclassified Brevundimonas]
MDLEDGTLNPDVPCGRPFIVALTDAVNAVSGKWKLGIICTMLDQARTFTEIQNMLETITPRMLSRELRELELNGVVERGDEVSGGAKGRKYRLTASGQQLDSVIVGMARWGQTHRLAQGGSKPAGQGT